MENQNENQSRVGVQRGDTVRVDGEGFWTVRQVEVDGCDGDVSVLVLCENNSDSREVWVSNTNGDGWLRDDTGEETTLEVC